MAALEAAKGCCRVLEGKRIGAILKEASLIRAVHSSLAIEGNGLEVHEVADILNGKQVIGPFDEIVEAEDALKAYDLIDSLDTWVVDDFLRAQDEMTFGLVEEPGFRTVGVGVFEGDRLIYKAPDASEVGTMMDRLFEWCSESDLPAPIIASVAHFYIESIHPFVDGNGRMGRLWSTKILVESDPLYRLVPMEVYMGGHKDEYYAALEGSQHQDGFDCTEFVRFCLGCFISAFSDLQQIEEEEMEELLSAMTCDPMGLEEIMDAMGMTDRGRFIESHIRPAMEYGLISQIGMKNSDCYRRLV